MAALFPIGAKAATANLNDMEILQTDSVFQARALSSLVQYCESTVLNEAISASNTAVTHLARKTYCVGVLNNPQAYKTITSYVASSNQTCANDTTAGGTLVGQTGTQVATAALLCTDTDMNNAIASAFNALVSGI
jgi:hypothetical protein